MAVVEKRLTQRIVAPSCARSNRVSRPIYCKSKRVSITADTFSLFPEQHDYSYPYCDDSETETALPMLLLK